MILHERKINYMKKKLHYIMVSVCILLMLSSCKSSEATAVDEMILDLFPITSESEISLLAVDKSIESLTQEQFEELGNIEEFYSAYQQYYQILADNIIETIESIGQVTLEDENIVRTAWDMYYASCEEVQNLVYNYELIEQAEDEIMQLQANEVIAHIDAIGTVTLDSGSAIDLAQDEFDNLPSLVAEKVTNNETLMEAQDTLSLLQLTEKYTKLNTILEQFTVTENTSTGANVYFSPHQPQYANEQSYVLPFIMESEIAYLDAPTTYVSGLTFNYNGQDWIFFDSIAITTDSESYSYEFKSYDINRQTGYGEVVEQTTLFIGNDDIDMIADMATSGEVVVRFIGDDGSFDLTLSTDEQWSLGVLAEAYQYFPYQEILGETDFN